MYRPVPVCRSAKRLKRPFVPGPRAARAARAKKSYSSSRAAGGKDDLPKLVTNTNLTAAASKFENRKPQMPICRLCGPTRSFGTEMVKRAVRSKASQQLEDLTIVGAGISGLATAAALQNIAGVDRIHIIESVGRESFYNDRSGAGAQVGPNGLRALYAIGGEELVESVISSGSKLDGNLVLAPNAPTPVRIADTAEEDTGLPQVLLRWSVLRSLLANEISDFDECIHFDEGESVMGWSSTTDETGDVRLVTACDTVIGPASSPLIVGADGIYSTFRKCVKSGSSKIADLDERKEGIRYNDRLNVKAVIETTLNHTAYEKNHTISYITPETACFAGPAGEGYTYWAISMADHTGPGDFLSSDGDEMEKGDVIRAGLKERPDKALVKSALLARLRLTQPPCDFVMAFADMIEKTDSKHFYVQISQEAESIGPRFVSSDFKVVCVGDSAHSMSGGYGQSINFALEDAATLAVCIRDIDDVPSALQKYEDIRLDRCNEMQRRSAERSAKAMKGEQSEDASKWIFKWDVPNS